MRVRWFRVFDQALRSSEVIAVWRVVKDHLERPLTRGELTAARRAANRYAAASRIRMVRVPAPAGSGGIRAIPLLARSDADLGDIERLTAIASGKITAGPHRGRAHQECRSAGRISGRHGDQGGARIPTRSARDAWIRSSPPLSPTISPTRCPPCRTSNSVFASGASVSGRARVCQGQQAEP